MGTQVSLCGNRNTQQDWELIKALVAYLFYICADTLITLDIYGINEMSVE